MRHISFLILYLAISSHVLAQSKKLNVPDVEDATPAHWSTPEAVFADLRSDDDQKRLTAFHLVGIQTGIQTGKQVPTLDQVQLRYATLAEDGSQQAIITAQIGYDYEYAAIATPSPGGWQRIGAFSCWCKYERGDVLESFVHLEISFEGEAELVINDSGGGTGLYEQTESRFRMRNGRLVGVASFMSRMMSCPTRHSGPLTCQLERRWFEPNLSGEILVEGRATLPPDKLPEMSGWIRDLDGLALHRLTCTGYVWDSNKFRYVERPLTKNPCLAPRR